MPGELSRRARGYLPRLPGGGERVKLSELAERIGQVGYLRSEAFRVPVRILDGKSSYGEPRYLVTPEGGEGQAWVNATRVSFR